MTSKTLVWLLLIVLISCEKKSSDTPHSKINENPFLANGKWLSEQKSSDGIAIIDGKIAFFQDNNFNSDDIYEYSIIDSVFENRQKSNISYLKFFNISDTLYYQIINRSNNDIELKFNDGKNYKYNLEKK